MCLPVSSVQFGRRKECHVQRDYGEPGAAGEEPVVAGGKGRRGQREKEMKDRRTCMADECSLPSIMHHPCVVTQRSWYAS